MQLILICFIACIFKSCIKLIDNDLKLINGYWEIVSVSFKDEKFYFKNKSNLIDFYSLTSIKYGYKKKIELTIAGKYMGSKDISEFNFITENGSLFLHFKTPFNTWKERIISLTKDQLILEQNNKTYKYKKFYPLKIYD